jgi:hypothetical protein
VPRYYFNLIRKNQVITDLEGVNIPDSNLEEAITRAIEEIRSEEPELFADGGEWSIEVVDDHGRRVATFPV